MCVCVCVCVCVAMSLPVWGRMVRQSEGMLESRLNCCDQSSGQMIPATSCTYTYTHTQRERERERETETETERGSDGEFVGERETHLNS